MPQVLIHPQHSPCVSGTGLPCLRQHSPRHIVYTLFCVILVVRNDNVGDGAKDLVRAGTHIVLLRDEIYAQAVRYQQALNADACMHHEAIEVIPATLTWVLRERILHKLADMAVANVFPSYSC